MLCRHCPDLLISSTTATRLPGGKRAAARSRALLLVGLDRISKKQLFSACCVVIMQTVIACRGDDRKARSGKKQPPSGGIKHYCSHVARSAQRYALLPAALTQERYRTAGRVLQARADRRVLAYATGGASAARRAPAKRDRSVKNKKRAEGLPGRKSPPQGCGAYSV